MVRKIFLFFTRLPNKCYPWGLSEGYAKDLKKYGWKISRLLFWREFHHMFGGYIILSFIYAMFFLLYYHHYLFPIILVSAFSLIFFLQEMFTDGGGKLGFKEWMDGLFWTLGFIIGTSIIYFTKIFWLGFLAIPVYGLFCLTSYLVGRLTK